MASVSKLKNQARHEEQRENWSKAIELYSRALESSVKRGEAVADLSLYNRIGDIYLRIGQKNTAVRYYEEAIDHYATQELHSSAIALCNKVLRIQPRRAAVFLQLGRLHMATNLVVEAREHYHRFAEHEFDAGRTPEALDALSELIGGAGDRPSLALWAKLATSLDEEERNERLDAMDELLEPHGLDAHEVYEAVAGGEELDASFTDLGAGSGRELPGLPFLDQLPTPGGGPQSTSAEEIEAVEGESQAPGETDVSAPEAVDSPEVDEPVDEPATAEVGDAETGEGTTAPDADSTSDDEESEPEFTVRYEAEAIEHEDETSPAAFDVPFDAEDEYAEDADQPETAVAAYAPEDEAADIGELDTAGEYSGDLEEDPEGIESGSVEFEDPSGSEALESAADGEHWGPDATLTGEDAEHVSFVGPEFGPGLADESLDLAQAGEDDRAGAWQSEAEERFASPDPASSATPVGAEATHEVAAEQDPQGAAVFALEDDEEPGAQERELEQPEPALGMAVLETPAAEPDPDHIEQAASDPDTEDTLYGALSAAETAAGADDVEAAAQDDALSGMEPLVRPYEPDTEGIEELPAAADESLADEHEVAAGGEAEPRVDEAVETSSTADSGEAADAHDPDEMVESDDCAADASTEFEDDGAHVETDTSDEPLDPMYDSPVEPAAPIPTVSVEPTADVAFQEWVESASPTLLSRALTELELRGEVGKVVMILDRLVAMDPMDIRHHHKRAQYKSELGDDRAAAEAFVELGQTLEAAGSAFQAREAFQSALARDPQCDVASEALERLADAEPQDDPEFLTGTAADLRLDPRSPAGMMNATYGSSPTNGLDTLDPNAVGMPRPRPYSGVAGGSEAGTDFEQLLNEFRAELTDRPAQSDSMTRTEIGANLKQMGKLDDAIRELQAAVREPQAPPQAFELLGEAFREKGQVRVAVRLLEKALHNGGHSDRDLLGVLYQLGVAHQELDEPDRALGYYERIFSVDIDYKDVQERILRCG